MRELLEDSFWPTSNMDRKVDEAVKRLQQEVWIDLALWVARKKVDWFVEFARYGAEKFDLEYCEDCNNKFKEIYANCTK